MGVDEGAAIVDRRQVPLYLHAIIPFGRAEILGLHRLHLCLFTNCADIGRRLSERFALILYIIDARALRRTKLFGIDWLRGTILKPVGGLFGSLTKLSAVKVLTRIY